MFPSFALPRQVLSSDGSEKFLLGLGSFFLLSEGVVCRSCVSSGGRTSWAPLSVESLGPATRQEVSQRYGDAVTLCMEVVKRVICKAYFSKEVAEVVIPDLRKSTACLYQGKWSRFLHWCCGRNNFLCKATVSQIVVFLYLRESCSFRFLLLRAIEPPYHVFVAITDSQPVRLSAGCSVALKRWCPPRCWTWNGACLRF